jgi:uncharacterized membrane protein YfcA
MRSIFSVLFFLAVISVRSQGMEITGPIYVYSGSSPKHEQVWTTSILGAANVFVSVVNIRQFKNAERKSNAGFLLFPGLLQLSVGAFYKKADDPTRKLDIAIGASSALLCTARLLYKPRKDKTSTTYLRPWCLPSKGSFAFGICLKYTL